MTIGGLFIASTLAHEYFQSSSLEPEVDRQGLEFVALLSSKGRDVLENQLGQAQYQIQVLARFFDQDKGTLMDPGPSLLTASQLEDPWYFKKVDGAWRWIGESALAPAPEDSIRQINDKENRWVQRQTTGWRLWIRAGAQLLSIRIPESRAKIFRDMGAGSKAYVFLQHDGKNNIAFRTLDADPDQDRWREWVDRAGQAEKVETLSANGKDYFVAYAPSGKYPFSILTLWPKDVVQSQWRVLRIRTWAVTLILLGAGFYVVLALIRRLMQPIERLEMATRQVADGQFDLSFGEKRSDEIGTLMVAFEQMSQKISELVLETRDKARMEVELNTAKLIQDNFFPQHINQFENIKITGRTATASECGGDLWACWHTEDFVFALVGDATGHGVPAALITSSLRAVISVFESSKTLSIPLMIQLLRKAIEDSGRGKTCVTTMLFQIEKTTGFMRIFNAGHEPAYLLPAEIPEKYRWKDIEIIFDPVNSVLGDPPAGAEQIGTLQLSPGQRVISITDGIKDIKGTDGEGWKDRDYLKALIEAFREPSTEQGFQVFWQMAETRRNGAELLDDLSVVVIEWRPKHPSN